MKISIKEFEEYGIKKYQCGLRDGRAEIPKDAQTWQKLAKQFEESVDESIKKCKELENEVKILTEKLRTKEITE